MPKPIDMLRHTNADQDQEFCEHMPEMGLHIDLSKVLDYVANNFEPGDVFEKPRLAEWAADKSPSQIFDFHVLDEWATAQGYEIVDPVRED